MVRELVLNEKLIPVKAGDVINIPVRSRHAIRAVTDLEFIEVQTGSDLVEEDIVRLYRTWEEIMELCLVLWNFRNNFIGGGGIAMLPVTEENRENQSIISIVNFDSPFYLTMKRLIDIFGTLFGFVSFKSSFFINRHNYKN